VSEFVLFAGGAVVVALLAGLVIGAALARRRFNQHYEEVRFEITRLNDIAEKKLAGDDPNIETLLTKLNETVGQAIKAAEALENQSKIIRRKTQGGREIVRSSRIVAHMIDEFTGEPPEAPAPAQAPDEPKQQPRVTDGAAPEVDPPDRLR